METNKVYQSTDVRTNTAHKTHISYKKLKYSTPRIFELANVRSVVLSNVNPGPDGPPAFGS